MPVVQLLGLCEPDFKWRCLFRRCVCGGRGRWVVVVEVAGGRGGVSVVLVLGVGGGEGVEGGGGGGVGGGGKEYEPERADREIYLSWWNPRSLPGHMSVSGYLKRYHKQRRYHIIRFSSQETHSMQRRSSVIPAQDEVW